MPGLCGARALAWCPGCPRRRPCRALGRRLALTPAVSGWACLAGRAEGKACPAWTRSPVRGKKGAFTLRKETQL